MFWWSRIFVVISLFILNARSQTVSCIGEGSCVDRIINCVPNVPCLVICDGKAACDKVSVVGTYATDVHLYCEGENSCKPAALTCGIGDCVLACTSGKNACDGLEVTTTGAKSFQCPYECPTELLFLQFSASPTRSPSRYLIIHFVILFVAFILHTNCALNCHGQYDNDSPLSVL